MADVAMIPSDRLRAPDRERALTDLGLLWNSTRAASAYVQQLDAPIVRVAVWGDSYANAQAILDSALARLESWGVCRDTPEGMLMAFTRERAYSHFLAARRYLIAFDWNRAQGQLFGAGKAALLMADEMGELL